jgi:DNA polymerase-3 subunit beta
MSDESTPTPGTAVAVIPAPAPVVEAKAKVARQRKPKGEPKAPKAPPAVPTFTVSSGELAVATSHITRAVSNRTGGLPVLSCVHVTIGADKVTLIGTDLDVSVTTVVAATATVPGSFLIPAKMLENIAKAASDRVTISITDDKVSFVAGDFTGTIDTLPVGDFPPLGAPLVDAIPMDAIAIRQGIKRTVPAASTDDNRPILTGVLCSGGEKLVMAATDSWRLGVATLNEVPMADRDLLVPARVLDLLSRILRPDDDTVDVAVSDRSIEFTTTTVRLSGRLIEGTFPNYANLLPTKFARVVVVAKAPLIQAVKRAQLFADPAQPVIRLRISPKSLDVSAVSLLGTGGEPIDCKATGGAITVGYNPDYLLAGLKMVEGEYVTLSLNDHLKPAVVTAEGEPGTYLLMPVRIPDEATVSDIKPGTGVAKS